MIRLALATMVAALTLVAAPAEAKPACHDHWTVTPVTYGGERVWAIRLNRHCGKSNFVVSEFYLPWEAR